MLATFRRNSWYFPPLKMSQRSSDVHIAQLPRKYVVEILPTLFVQMISPISNTALPHDDGRHSSRRPTFHRTESTRLGNGHSLGIS